MLRKDRPQIQVIARLGFDSPEEMETFKKINKKLKGEILNIAIPEYFLDEK